jgi:hypothetical protein
VLKRAEIDKIERLIEESREETGLNYRVNTIKSDTEIGKDLNKYEKSVIINLVFQEDKKYKVSINLSQDIDVTASKENIGEVLENSEKALKKGEFSNFFKDLIIELNVLLNPEKVEVLPEEEKPRLWKYLIIIIPILFFKKIVKNFRRIKLRKIKNKIKRY